MELETVNKLYLELSHIATATTERELRLKNIGARLAGALWDFHGICPECGSHKGDHMQTCSQVYETEFNGPADFQRVFDKAFGLGA